MTIDTIIAGGRGRKKRNMKKEESGDERENTSSQHFFSLFDPHDFEAAVLWVDLEDLTIRQICVNIVLGLCI